MASSGGEVEDSRNDLQRSNSSRASLSSKLPRATLEEKIQILNFYHRSGKLQSDTVEEFKNQFAISTSSFSEWLKHETDLRERYNRSASLTELSGNHIRQSKRKVRFKYEKINQAMDSLVERRLLDGLPINEPILREHWALYARRYGVDDPKRLYSFSHGWLSQFKKRHGLDKKTMVELNRRANTNSPNRIAADDTNASHAQATDSRFYEVNQLLNSPQLLSTNNGSAETANNADQNSSQNSNGNRSSTTGNGSSHLHGNGSLITGIDTRTFSDQQRLILGQQYLSSQVPGAFGNQSFSMIPPYIRLDNQVNRNGNNNQLIHSLTQNQQQQMGLMGSNQVLQHQLDHQLGNSPLQLKNNPKSKNNSGKDNSNNSNNSNNNNLVNKNLLMSTGSNITDLSGNEMNSSMVRNLGSVNDDPEDVLSEDELFTISMEDIEKFMYQWCDKFFHDHQQQFPRTSKIFRNFKDSFMREKFKAMMNGGGGGNSSSSSSGGVPRQIGNNDTENHNNFNSLEDDDNMVVNANSAVDANANSNINVDDFFLRNAQTRVQNQN